MWPTRDARLAQIGAGLVSFSQNDTLLRGAVDSLSRLTLAKQMIASLRRLDFTKALLSRDVHPNRADPNSPMFDAERAAIFHSRNGNVDEAIWLIFLSIHFGKHSKHGWTMLQDVYSGSGREHWTWQRVSAQPMAFAEWMGENRDRIGGAFGNHRKYETLDPNSKSSTTLVISSFVNACAPSPSSYFNLLTRSVGNDPKKIFDAAYHSLTITRFGRLAKFDFLCLLGRMGLAPLQPGSAYLKGATGPLKGARLLIDGNSSSATSAEALDLVLQRLDQILNVGMQVMEDSLCNWQKSPQKFIHFRG